MDAHVTDYYEFLEAEHEWAVAEQMRAAENRWVDAGCPSNGFYDDGFYD